jgi:hypothetical protein
MFARIALAVPMLLAAPMAAAQSIPDTVEGIASDLAFGYCPLYLAGQFPLTGNEKLTALGFTNAPQTIPGASVGDSVNVSQQRGDVTLSFGGIPNKLCQVQVIGADPKIVLAKLHEGLGYLPYTFKPVPESSGTQPNGATVETVKAEAQPGVMLNVQLVQATLQDGSKLVGAQLFVTDK